MKELTIINITQDELINLIRETVASELKKINKVESNSLLNSDEACNFLKITKSTLYKLTMDRKIPHYKPTGKRVYFKKSDLEKWIISRRIKTSYEIDDDATNYLLFRQRK